LPAKPTTKVEMIGNLVVSSSSHSISSVQVFDATGAAQTLSIAFTKQTSTPPNTTWKVDISLAGAVIGTGNIAFGADGSPVANANTVTFSLTSNGQTQSIVLDFGSPSSFNLATQSSGSSSTLGAKVIDGSAIAGLTGFNFDEKGVIKYTYSNGEKRDGPQIGLAAFADETTLIAGEKSLYRAPGVVTPRFGIAGTDQFGRISGGHIELSNVDLSQEFGDILIIQRGYQASSRVMTVANEMLEQLYNNTRGG
jgi:flagellar hook protein FlgE